MKLLESAPWRYDLGIKLLTLGVDAKIKRRIAEVFIHSSDRVLEVGCGTGTLALMCARKGASVTGFDVSPVMVELARLKAKREKPAARVQFLKMDVTEMDRFPDGSFDVVVATLVFSELSEVQQAYVLRQAWRILRPGGGSS